MDYYIQEIQVDKGLQRTAGIKARDDIDTIFQSLDIKKITIPTNKKDRNSGKKIYKMYAHFAIYQTWKKQLKKLNKKDRLFIQFPVIEHSILLAFLLNKIEKKGIQVILLIHDLELLRVAKRKDISLPKKIRLTLEEKGILFNSTRVIVHNENMKKYICELGVKEDKVITLEIFDYLINGFDLKRLKVKRRTDPVIIAGNLRRHKAQYVYQLPETYNYNLYGVDYDGEVNNRIVYHGSYAPEELPYVLEGGFGLVWDGVSVDTCSGVYGEYLKINNPHKTSLYLASGIPVMIWSKAALADFVKKYNVGITIESLNDLNEVVGSITEQEYETMINNVNEISEKLRSGFFTKQAIKQC
ncbi:MAG: hypothetical protein Q4D45_04390 [Lachnospiraceae bacterium]|nr:hypothetical protein [Lachnospiraceae bacterium]